MARAIRKRKDGAIVVDIVALAGFLDEFDPSWIPILAQICDEVPADTAGALNRWIEADIATDVLGDLFGPDSSGRGESYPRVSLDAAKGQLIFHFELSQVKPDLPKSRKNGGAGLMQIHPRLADNEGAQN